MFEDIPLQQARLAFRDAHRQALVSGILDLLRRESSNLISFEEVRARLNVRGQHARGLMTVPIAHIVGSEGRYDDFDRRFLPRKEGLKQRWSSLQRAMELDTPLPAIELYKISDVYFVRDGNHRVSVARQRGQIDIDADVTELLVDVPLEPDLSVRDLMLKEEYSDFLEWTELHRLRPNERIEFSEAGGYLDLVRHINAHRYYMGLEQKLPQGEQIPRDDAVAHWYDTVYVPVADVIRTQQLLRHFPGRTEADLYRWIMEHRWYLREELGHDPGPAEAARHYVDRYSQRDVLHQLVGMLTRLLPE